MTKFINLLKHKVCTRLLNELCNKSCCKNCAAYIDRRVDTWSSCAQSMIASQARDVWAEKPKTKKRCEL